jgi:non-canonical purine NTP pyrophosphatase (RdgB/HAM1 family)
VSPEASATFPSFTLVTGNPDKLLEAERILGFRPDAHPLDLPELQSLDLEEVLREKGEEAWRRLAKETAIKAVVVEETGLFLPALGGFPGPLVKWMLQAMGAEGIARCAGALGDTRATAHCALYFRDADRRVVAHGKTSGHLLSAPRGNGGFGWDPVFVPDGYQVTYAELTGEVKDEIGHRGRAWRRFQELLRDS